MKKLDSGFTIIEVLVGILIISVLVVISVNQYKKFQIKAKITEAYTNLGAIRNLEESFVAEYDIYVVCASTPASKPTPRKRKWPVVPDNEGFGLLGFKPAGDVYFSYAVREGNVGGIHGGVGYNVSTVLDDQGNFRGPTPQPIDGISDITIYATGDLDGDGIFITFYTTDEIGEIISYPPGAGKIHF